MTDAQTRAGPCGLVDSIGSVSHPSTGRIVDPRPGVDRERDRGAGVVTRDTADGANHQ